MSIRTLLNEAKTCLVNLEDPGFEAEMLLMHCLDVTRTFLHTRVEYEPSDCKINEFNECVKKRASGMPLAYITGHKEFWSLDLEVNQNTLIPRPDTELLVELALQRFGKSNINVADLGTGCGTIALSLASERPNWGIVATDLSLDALDIATKNAKRHKLSNVEFRHGSWCDVLTRHNFDLILSNPPYIAHNDTHLEQDGVCMEPKSALIGGKNGLESIRTIVYDAPAYLVPGGWLMLEHGYEQGNNVRELLHLNDYRSINTYLDISGNERVTIGQI